VLQQACLCSRCNPSGLSASGIVVERQHAVTRGLIWQAVDLFLDAGQKLDQALFLKLFVGLAVEIQLVLLVLVANQVAQIPQPAVSG